MYKKLREDIRNINNFCNFLANKSIDRIISFFKKKKASSFVTTDQSINPLSSCKDLV